MSATLDEMTVQGMRELNNDIDNIRVSDYVLAKRPYVRLVGVALGVIISPVICLLVILVRLTSPGPGLYRQQRVGLNGEAFTIYKIRSMRNDAERHSGPVWASRKDSRVTPLGRLLRFTHLDELPQIINVIKGEMDFVGPRPERPEMVEDLLGEVDGYEDRHAVLPGITGLAQINLEPDQEIECVRKKVAADRHYIQNATFTYDVRLISATALRMLGLRYYHGARLMGVTLPASAQAIAYDSTSLGEAEGAAPPTADRDLVLATVLCASEGRGDSVDFSTEYVSSASGVRLPR